MTIFSGLLNKKSDRILNRSSADNKIGIWNWDIRNDSFQINRFWYEKLGFGKNIIRNLDNFITIVHPDEQDFIKNYANKLLNNTENYNPDIEIECRIKRTDGEWLWIFLSGKISGFKKGKPFKAEGIILDITRQKQIESELQNKNSEIEALYEESEAQNEEMASMMDELQNNHLELEEANNRLTISESKLRNIIENSPIGIIQSQLNGSIIRVNSAFCKAFGYNTDEELISERPSVHHFYHDKRARERIIKSLSINNIFYEHDLVGLKKDGSYVYVNIYFLRLSDKYTHEDYLTSFVEDITELKKSQFERDLFFNNSGDLILISTKSGEIKQINPAWTDIFGWEPEELISMSLNEIIHPDDLKKTLEFRDRLASAGERLTLTGRYRTKKGDYRIIRWISVYFKETDHIFSSGRDETERYEAEMELQKMWDRLDLALKSGTIGLWDFSLKENTLTFNSNLADIVGFNRIDNVDLIWREYLHEDDFRKSARAMLDLINGNKDTYIDEYRLKLPDGNFKWLFSRGKIVERDNEGKPVRIAGSVTDITEQKEAENKRLLLEHQMLQAQKLESLGLLAGGIAHDFNNLLTGILGNADMLLYELPENEPYRQKLNEIRKAVKRASELTHQMLAYSGKSTFTNDVIDLNLLIEEISSLLDVSISKKVKLVYTLEENLSYITGNSTQISQILMNLILNASEAIENNGEVRITTSSAECSAEMLNKLTLNQNLKSGKYVILEISDTGCGISQEKLKQIFDPFFTTKFTGRGLGLAAVSGIIRSHKAGLDVKSIINEGTSFTIYFPASDKTPANRFIEIKKPVDVNIKHKTVLVADDEAYIRSLTARMLKTAGFDVLLAANGVEAINIYREKENDISCILLDLTMPELDGHEALMALRKINRDVPIIISSGYSQFDISPRFESGSISGFLQKPYQFEDLLQVIDKALNIK